MKLFIRKFNLAAVAIVVVLSACSEKSEKDKGYCNCVSILPLSNECSSVSGDIVDSVFFIDLHYSLAGVEKVILDDDDIYVLSDRYGRPKVVRFDYEGIPTAKYGAFGHGKSEYTRISDFDVYNDTVYIHDGHSHKMYVYARSGEFMTDYDTDCHAQAFIMASTDSVIFMPLKFGADEELAYADLTLSVCKPILKTRPNSKDSYASFNYFTRCREDKILYYHSPYDMIHLINADGHICDSYKIDFGEKNLPDEAVNDFGDALSRDTADEYCYVDDCPVMTGRYIIGRFYNCGTPATFVYDINTGMADFKAYTYSGMAITDIVNPVTVYGDKVIGVVDGSYLEYLERPELLPERTKEHLQNGGFSLALYSI